MDEQVFAYSPVFVLDPNGLSAAHIARLVVLDQGVPDVSDHVGEIRIAAGQLTAFPSGLYTFAGIESPLALYVPLGGDSSDASAAPLEGLADDHPLAEAWRWAEHWWDSGTPVAAPKYSVLQGLLQKNSGIEVAPSQRRFAHGRWTYKITVDGETQWTQEDSLEAAAHDDDPTRWVTQEPAHVDRFSATLTRAKLTGRLADTLFSFRATRTIFRPYQFKPVMKLLETGKDRLLIADEVGLGKTIEAGLVWTEMEARGQADRVMVICPSGLLGKWEEEMEQRFGFELDELDLKGLDKFLTRHKENRLPQRFRYITSLERLRTWTGLEDLADTPPELDLVIVDEAHAMRNTSTRSNAMGALLQDWSDAIIFLTATPINLHQKDLYNLLELLVPEDLGDFEDLKERLEPNRALNALGRMISDPKSTPVDRVQTLRGIPDSRYGIYLKTRPDLGRLREIVGAPELRPEAIVEARRLIADLNTLSTVITRTKKADVDEQKALRVPMWKEVVWTPEEARFYGEFLQWCKERADASSMPIYFAMQMPLRLASACLPMARRAVLSWSADLFESDSSDEDGFAKFSPSQLVQPHDALIDAAEALPTDVDTKFDQLLPVVEEMVAEGRRTLLFTFSRPTLSYLKGRLGERFRVAVLHGGVDRETRRRVMVDFRAGAYDLVLANKVASEGLDFEFCSAIINYDLPWNPMEIEQRIGRIDRIGQKEDKLLVASFRNDETIDERIIYRVLERMDIFEDSIGALEPIVNRQMKVLTEAFNFELSEEERADKLNQFLAAVEENKAGLEDVADASTALIVGNDIDVSGLEDTLEKSGKYIGQSELARLIADWATIEGAPGVQLSPDGKTISVRGNPEMARRVEALANSRRRTRAEVVHYVDALRSGVELHFVLDQELARTGKFDLLTATNPLVMAATEVPGHQEVRFTHASAPRHDDSVPTGTYLVVLARATRQPRDESELWATAIDMRGQIDDGPVASALLSALARGAVGAPLLPLDRARLQPLTQRAMDSLHERHARESSALMADHAAQAELRESTLVEQHKRKISSIDKRMQTNLDRGRDAVALRLVEGQRKKAQRRHRELLDRLVSEPDPSITLVPVAVCVLEVTK